LVFKEKKLHKNKSLVDWKEKEKLEHSFEEAIKGIQQKEPPRDLPRASTVYYLNQPHKFDSNTENQFTKPTKSTMLLDLSNLSNLPTTTHYGIFD
jgi:hypothetical protein